MSHVRKDAAEGVLTLTIDREERRNALNRATLEELEAALQAADADPGTRVVVLRGAGERAFCAGADLGEMLAHESIEASRRHFDGLARVMRLMHRIGPPVIARVPGLRPRRRLRSRGRLRFHDRLRERRVRTARDRHRTASAAGLGAALPRARQPQGAPRPRAVGAAPARRARPTPSAS